MDRNADLVRFYALLDRLQERGVRARRLADCSGRMNWPRRGVYFFYEIGETRSDSGTGLRVVRIGTHALKPEAKSTLWGRLRQHRGGGSGGGNHRGSIFRLIVGTALVSQEPKLIVSTWSVGSTADRATREGEHALECCVSAIIRAMPFVSLGVNDEPGAESLRGYVERNSIALLSNYERTPLDPASAGWLGHHCSRDRVRGSGLWNWRHVNERYDPAFLDTLEALIETEGLG